MVSLTKAIDNTREECVILFGDVLFKKYILSIMLDDPSDIVIIVDSVFSLEKNTSLTLFMYVLEWASLSFQKTTTTWKRLFMINLVQNTMESGRE